MRNCILSFDHLPLLVFMLFYSIGISGCSDQTRHCDVLVVGGGTGAISAAIQSARSGAGTILVHPYPWLGGMLTAAGVSATDGNHQLPAGLWNEFRQLLRKHYGGADSLFTGWVSNTMFEPHVGARYWASLAAQEELLEIIYAANWELPGRKENWVLDVTTEEGNSFRIEAPILIDGTDLGDVAAEAGIAYDLGMDAAADFGESIAPEKANSIVQDITYVAILKDYGADQDMTIDEPAGYTPEEFFCTCQHPGCSVEDAIDCTQMMNYGRLPGNKYMINWPRAGNDYGVNMVEMGPDQRAKARRAAKEKTLRYVYFLQDELGFRHLGLADDEYPTPDRLPFYPYHREGRRIRGLVRMDLSHITDPYHDGLYRTGIAVGDYPIDHHHAEVPEAPQIDFPPVPSYTIPMGVLIPSGVEGFLVADKSISVTNIVNGTTRLQPVVIQLGQTAGLLAAMAFRQDKGLKDLDIREVQQHVLDYGGYLVPFFDVRPDDTHFQEIQRIGVTGVLRGVGVPYQWANRTYFYPDTSVEASAFMECLEDYTDGFNFVPSDGILSVGESIRLIHALAGHLGVGSKAESETDFREMVEVNWQKSYQLSDFDPDRPIRKREMAVLLDRVCDLFQIQKLDYEGHWK